MVSSRNIKNSWYLKYLACPDCKKTLDIKEEIKCKSCDYTTSLSQPISIKPNDPTPCVVKLPRTIHKHPNSILNSIKITPPKISYLGPPAIRDSAELISELSKYLNKNATVLDLGCGPRDQAIPIEYLGYKYVGVDYSNNKSDLLADAHAIPFKAATFDCILSYAVLEHLHNPFIAIHEIERVLKPGGIYVGTVSQGEPFHDSYFHHTAWGLLSLISSVTTFQVQRLWASGDTLGSLSRMGKYPRVIKQLIRIIHKLHQKLPILAPRKMKWSDNEKLLDRLYRAGSICFVVKKPEK